ncbi:MAG: NADH-quinone oxidoreductase subunit NuoK [bacterium]
MSLLLLATLLFITGLVGVVHKRHPLIILMSIELMLNAANLGLVTWARAFGGLHLEAQAIALMLMTVAASEVGVGLALVVMIFKDRAQVSVDDLNELHG